MLHKRVPSTAQHKSLFLTAVENTWIHGRQKRREQKRNLRELPRAPPAAMAASQTTATTTGPATTAASSQTKQPSTQSTAIPETPSDQATTTDLASLQPLASPPQPATTTLNDTSLNVAVRKEPGKPAVEQPEVLGSVADKDVDMMDTQTPVEAPKLQEKQKEATKETVPVKRPLTPGSVQEFLFKCLLELLMEEGSAGVVVEMHWVEGQSKDLMNQLCTYLKNSLLKMVASP